MTPLILVSDVDQTQTLLKIANVSDQTHIRYINRGILPVWYNKATGESEDSKHYHVLTPFILVSDVNQTQTLLKIANVSNQTPFRHINWGILPVWYDNATAESSNNEQCHIVTPLIGFQKSIKLKLYSKLQMFLIKLILGISTEGYYQFDMTKPQLDLRTSNDVKFWLLSYWFFCSNKLKLNSKLQMFPIKLILGISTEEYYQFDMTKIQLNLKTMNDVIFWLLLYWFQTSIKLKLYSKLQKFLIKLRSSCGW